MSVTYSFPGDASKTSNRILQIEEMLDEQVYSYHGSMNSNEDPTLLLLKEAIMT